MLRSEADQIRQRDIEAEPLDGTSLAMRLLGALSPQQDLATIRRSQINGNSTAQYDRYSKTLYVLASKTPYSPLDRALIAHEYTRVLLDQNFDLNALVGVHSDSAGHNSDAQLAAEALVEGDAYTTMLTYATTTFSRQDILLFNQELQQPSNPTLDFLHDQIAFPAEQGTSFVRYLIQVAAQGKHGGAARLAANAAINHALLNPPASTSEVLNPSLYLHHVAVVPETTDALKPGADWTEVDSDVLGAFGIGDLFSQRAPHGNGTQVAVQAASAWQSDRWMVYKRGADTMLIWKAHFTSAAGAQAFVRALSSYTATRFRTTLDTKAPLNWHTKGYAMAVRQQNTEAAVAISSNSALLDLCKQMVALLGFS
jgi:hypothetical protein